MSALSSCPPADRLQRLLTEPPPAPEQAELIAHLDNCVACQHALEELAGAGQAVLGAANVRTAYGDEACLRRALEDLRTDVHLSLLRPQHRIDWVQSLLQPVNYLEALGQLEDFEVTELLGQGGMGIVLKAFEPALKRWVAIKVLAPDLAGDSVARQRFAREAQAAAAVRHPHVVTIHAVRETNGVPFLVMEYVAGGSLQDYVDRHEPPDWQTAARLGAEIAEGMAAAHAQGLIHRDIKPSNILLAANTPGADATGLAGLVAKIGDFGLARVVDEVRLTQTNTAAGTPMYMAPEQALCETLDHRADLFSLGSVLYALCTGREPFPGGNPMAVLRHVCETTPRPIRELNPAVPPWLAATVERLQAKRPEDRFVSAADVAELLRYNLKHLDQPRLPPPPPGRWLKRNQRRLLTAILLAVLLLAGGLVLTESSGWTHLGSWWGSVTGHEIGVPSRAVLRGHRGPVWSVAFSPDGQSVVTGSDDTTIRFWDAATGEQQAELAGHSGAVLAVAFAHSGKFLVSGGADGTLRLWDVASRREQPPLPHAGGNVRRIAISPDDKTLAVGSAQGVELWNLGTRKTRLTVSGHDGSILAIAFSPDGKVLATGDASGHIRLWDPATGAELAAFVADPLGVRALAFSPDSQTLASAGTGANEVRFWQVATHEQIGALSGSDAGALNVALSRDGSLLAVGGRDGTVKLWNVHSGRLLADWHAHRGNVWATAFSPDGRTLASVGEDRLGNLWDVGGLEDQTR